MTNSTVSTKQASTTAPATLNLGNAGRIVANVTPALASAIFTSSKLPIEPVKGAAVSLAIVWTFIEQPLNTMIEVSEIITGLEYNLGRVRRLNAAINLGGSANNMLIVAEELNLITYSEDGLFLQLTEKWNGLVLAKNVTLPNIGMMKDSERNVPHVKGGKAKASPLLKECISFLQDTGYHVHKSMFEILTELNARIHTMPFSNIRNQLIKEMATYSYIFSGCTAVIGEELLTSPYDADTRARVYHAACAGPNPQASDLARSVYAHNVENYVEKTDSACYNMFLDELAETAGNPKFADAAYLARVARNPVEFLLQTLVKSLSTELSDRRDCPYKPFTLVRMAQDFMEFETTGRCDSRLGYGLDARCSGTQYFAILAGCAEMGEATGITTKKKSETTDPYVMSAKMLFDTHGYTFADRGFIKTPYMAVQYGGSSKALLTSKDNVQNLIDAGVKSADMADVAEHCIEAINKALGVKINNLKEVVQNTLADILGESGKTYISYKHSDGFTVFKPAAPKVEVCPSFSLFLGSGEQTMHFGKKGGQWTIQSKTPTAEEYVRTFMVNYIQGLDGLVARTVAVQAKRDGLRAYTSIHDCFRVCLADAPKLKNTIAKAYKTCFIDTDQHAHLMSTLGRHNIPAYTNIVTEEILFHKDSSYFCA